MITWIGLCAGEVWRYLDQTGGGAPLTELFSKVKAPKETILMAIGWLAREGYVILRGTLSNVQVTLNPQPPGKGK